MMFYKIGDWLCGLVVMGCVLLNTGMPATIDVFGFVQQFGPIVGLVIWFIWRDHQREKRMGSRINLLEDFQRNELLQALTDTSKVVGKNTEVIDGVTAVIRKCREKSSDA